MSELFLVSISFFASLGTAIFGMGGGIVLIALMPGHVPAGAILPLHAVVQLASNSSRVLFAWRHVDWSLVLPFLVGGIAGAALGARLFSQLDLEWLPAIIGAFILLITWVPLPMVRGKGNWPMVLLGFYQTGIGMVTGANGPLGAALLTQRSRERDWLVVNTAMYMTGNHVLRVLAFGVMGFAFAPYMDLLVAMSVAVIAGSWLGTRLRVYVPEGNFDFWFKILVSLLALRMIWIGLSATR